MLLVPYTTVNFQLNSENQIIDSLKSYNVSTWEELVNFIKEIPYGRNTSRLNPSLVITENRGTCSSKHALLKTIADQHEQEGYELVIGVYKMSGKNTPEVKNVLAKHKLTYIPEVHCYLKFKGEVIDVTHSSFDHEMIKDDILIEKPIKPNQVGNYKIAFHENYLQDWIQEEKIPYSFDEIWAIREACIEELSTLGK